MQKNKIGDLRDILFQLMEDLNSPEREITRMDIERAKQTTEAAKVILDMGVAEMKYKDIAVTRGHRVQFFEDDVKKLT